MQIFIKEQWIASWSAFSGSSSCVLLSRFFSCCTIMLPPTKLQVFANFWPKKCYNPLSPPGLSRFISAGLFSVPQVENEVKRTPFCGCCWDPRSRNWWITEGPKRGPFGSFSETIDRAKAFIYASGAYFELKKAMCLPHMSSICKKSTLKLLDRTVCVYIYIYIYIYGMHV